MKTSSAFRRAYEAHISKRLDLEQVEYYRDFYEIKQPFMFVVFGLAGALLAGYWALSGGIAWLWGIGIMAVSMPFLYHGLRKRRKLFALSKVGLWTSKFGFLYFRHIKSFEYYQYIGRGRSEVIRIHMHNPQLYSMSSNYLEQGIGLCELGPGLELLLNEKLLHYRKGHKR